MQKMNDLCVNFKSINENISLYLPFHSMKKRLLNTSKRYIKY